MRNLDVLASIDVVLTRPFFEVVTKLLLPSEVKYVASVVILQNLDDVVGVHISRNQSDNDFALKWLKLGANQLNESLNLLLALFEDILKSERRISLLLNCLGYGLTPHNLADCGDYLTILLLDEVIPLHSRVIIDTGLHVG